MKLLYKILTPLTVLIAPSFSAESLGEFIFHHMSNSNVWRPLPWAWATIHLPSNFPVGPVNMGISLHVLMLFFAAIILSITLLSARRRRSSIPVGIFGHIIEAFVIYIRDELVIPNIGKKDTAAWLPFFLTLFFFILSLNLLGLIPGMATATSNIFVTTAFALITFFSFNAAGIAHNGPVKYFLNLVPSGVPLPIAFILAPIELVGLLTKAFALAVRLFANMSAGHIIILSLLGLISVLKFGLLTSLAGVIPASIIFTLFIYLIELLVAFLQAYVFTLLSTLFIGMSIHQDH